MPKYLAAIQSDHEGGKHPEKQDIILLDCRGSYWFAAMWDGGTNCRELVDVWVVGGGGVFGSHTTMEGGGEQGSVCDIWSGAAAQNRFEGVHTFAEALSGSVSLSWEAEVHVETRCLPPCLEIQGIWWGFLRSPAKKRRPLRNTHKSERLPHQINKPLFCNGPLSLFLCRVSCPERVMRHSIAQQACVWSHQSVAQKRRKGRAYGKWQEIHLWAGQQQ